jgi:hypothetical protein
MIEKVDGNGYRSTPIGTAYLKNFGDFCSGRKPGSGLISDP